MQWPQRSGTTSGSPLCVDGGWLQSMHRPDRGGGRDGCGVVKNGGGGGSEDSGFECGMGVVSGLGHSARMAGVCG